MVRRVGLMGGLLLWGAFSLVLVLFAGGVATCEEQSLRPHGDIDVKSIPYKIVYESLRKEGGKENWELILINADGSNPVNLTKTPDVSEIYPHVSPDGTKVCFEANEGTDQSNMVRNLYCMNLDGTNRVKIAQNARQECWGPDSRTIAFLRSEFERYDRHDFATKGVYFYDLKTGKTTEHSNCANLYHLYNLCLSPDGKWFVATVHGGMGFKHADLAFPAQGSEIFDLTRFRVTGCRPDFSPDGKRICWGATDWDLFTASFDTSSGKPVVANVHQIVKCDKEHEVYHTDWSPDGKYIAFSYGPEADEVGGGLAPGWNICISDLSGNWVQITTDGNHNKEPDWVPTKN
jgi:Tol biopolymer transport system component